MNAVEFRTLRKRLGLSLKGTARFLRLSPEHGWKTVQRWETQQQNIQGTAEMVFEAIESGEMKTDLEPFRSKKWNSSEP